MRRRRWLWALTGALLVGGVWLSAWLGHTPYVGGFEPRDVGGAMDGARPVPLHEELDEQLDEVLHEVLIEEESPQTSVSAAEPTRWVQTVVRRSTPALQELESVLVVGLDRRRGHGWGRADSLLVVFIDRQSEHVGIVSVPRDLWVEVPQHGEARINATLLIAERLGLEPLETLRDVVGELLGARVDHAVALDLAAFERLVDSAGGVRVEVPCAIVDDFVDPSTESGRRILDVPAGEVEMDGATAAMYARSRHGRSDWSRARRQQAIALGLRRRLSGIEGFARWPRMLEEVERSVRTDMSRGELLSLAEFGLRVEADHLHGLVLGHRQMRLHRTSRGQQVLLPDLEALDAALGALFEAPSPGALPEHGRCQAREAALRPR